MKYALNLNNVRKAYALNADVWILNVPNRTTLKEMFEMYNVESLIENAKEKQKEVIIRNVRYEDKDAIQGLKYDYDKVFYAAATLQDLEMLHQEVLNVFSALPVTDKSTYDYLCNYLKVPKIIVGGELGFSLKYLAHNEGTEIMINPAHIYGEIGDLTSFFVRPEDIDLYKGIVDILYFTPKTRSYEEILFDIYKDKKKWYGNLQEIIINLNRPFYNHYLFKSETNFGESRLNCRKKCSRNRAKCSYCDYQAVLQHLIKEEEDKLKGGNINNG